MGPELGAGAEGEGCLIGDDGDMGCWSRGVAGAGDSGGLTESSLVLIAGVPVMAAEEAFCGVAGMPVGLGEEGMFSGLGDGGGWNCCRRCNCDGSLCRETRYFMAVFVKPFSPTSGRYSLAAWMSWLGDSRCSCCNVETSESKSSPNEEKH